MTGETGQAGFKTLSHPARVGILEALCERLKTEPSAPAIGFSELRREVGMRDSGNFNYHLDKLRGRFVRKTDRGYRITAAGLKLTGAVIAGTYSANAALGPTPLSDPCPACGERLTASYDSGLLTVSCPDDHEFRHPLPQGAVAERDLDEVVRLLTLTVHQEMQLASEGVCPVCNAVLSWSVEPTFEAQFPHFGTQCDRCGALFDLPVAFSVLSEPAGVRFYDDHGTDARRQPPWSPVFYDHVGVTERLPVEVTIKREAESLIATVSEGLSVVDIRREHH